MLAAAAAVGLLVVGTTVIAVYIRNKENRTSSAKARSPEDNTEPASDSSSPDKDRSVVMDEIQVRSTRFIVDRVLYSEVCGGSLFFSMSAAVAQPLLGCWVLVRGSTILECDHRELSGLWAPRVMRSSYIG